MIVYIVLWFIMTLCITYGTTNQVKKRRLILAGCIYVVTASCRDITMGVRDIPAYYQHFVDAVGGLGNFISESVLFETGYCIYVWVLRQILRRFSFFLIVSYGFIYISYVRFVIRARVNKKYCIVIGAILMGTLSAFYIFRIYLSIAMSLCMLININQKRWIRAFAWIIAAISFHNAAIILIPVYMFNIILENRNYLNKKKMFFVLVASILFIMICLRFVILFMSGHSKYFIYENAGGFAWGVYGSALTAYILSVKNLRNLIRNYPFAKTLMISLNVVFLVIPLQMQYAIMYRMALFFIPIIFYCFA